MAEIRIQRGFYFEEYTVGDFVITPGRTLTEADIVNFAGLSGDWNPIHVDAEFAKQGVFGERIAHGLLGLSIASGLAVQTGFITGAVIMFRGLDWKFSGAIKIGDTIHVRAEVAAKRAVPRLNGGLVTFNVEVINQHGETTQKGTWSMLVKLLPATGI